MGTVVNFKFSAKDFVNKIADDINDNTKVFAFFENEEGDLSVASAGFTATEILWGLETLKMSLMSGTFEQEIH